MTSISSPGKRSRSTVDFSAPETLAAVAIAAVAGLVRGITGFGGAMVMALGVALGAGERPRLQAAVEMELGRLLAERGIANGLASDVALDSVRGAAVQLQPGAGGAGLGRQVAQAVYGGIGK